MKQQILRDGTEHLEEIEMHEITEIEKQMHDFIKEIEVKPPQRFWRLDLGYPEMENIIMIKLCQSTGVPESYLIQNPKSRPWRL